MMMEFVNCIIVLEFGCWFDVFIVECLLCRLWFVGIVVVCMICVECRV